MNFSAAKEIAETWVRVLSDEEAVIDREKTIALPYGWVFFYNSPDYIADPSNIGRSFVGNVPILVDCINGDLRVLGPRYQEKLKEIEGGLPPACLLLKPEQPRW